MVDIDLGSFGGSALVDDTIAVPKHEDVEEMLGDAHHAIQITSVPHRTTIFQAFAVAVAEVRGPDGNYLGDNALEAFVSRLRKKLAGSGSTIRTLRGLGYLIEPDRPGAG